MGIGVECQMAAGGLIYWADTVAQSIGERMNNPALPSP